MKLFNEVNGSCPFCGGHVNIVEGTVLEYSIDANGYPLYLNEECYKLTGYCKDCCKQLFIIPNYKGGYDVYPGNVLALPTGKYFTSRRPILGDIVISSPDPKINPFINAQEKAYDDMMGEECTDEQYSYGGVEFKTPINLDDVPF